ncbi:hypothetical protein [Nocardioides halotolerans]|jgi:hypothetical protein|uniref:hypothetical protein n=1 Tax=Nocardioides halotolerans TaxID=433660 RepID=UPI00146ECA8A|nr:hypothetical protein [Nocardioides halotolerans]
MTTPVAPAEHGLSAVLDGPPPMPSIAVSALLESQLLLERARRTVAAWLTAGTRTG